MHRLKTRPQFQAALAGGTVARSPHFALHRLLLSHDVGGQAPPAEASTASSLPTGPGSLPAQGLLALFGAPGVWLGAMAPKRWARRAVTRNTIKRQIYTVALEYEARLAPAAHVVRLRSGFDRKQFVSATSDHLRLAVREELHQLFRRAVQAPAAGARPS